MPIILRGITHVIIITAPTKDAALKNSVYAQAEICFGPGDSNSIAQLEYTQLSNKRMIWKLPVVLKERDGVVQPLCVFNGGLAEELAQWASRAMDRIKKELGAPKLGQSFYVPTKGKVQNITDGAPA